MINWRKPKILILGCLVAIWGGVGAFGAFGAGAPFQNFISAHDGKLFDGDAEYRFISWNIPNLLIIEDNFAWNAPNDWLLPDEFELTDAFASVRQLGGTVVRSYSIPIQRVDENTSIPKYVRGLTSYNENAFRNFDLVLKLASQEHIRLILPLINNWPWQGGREDLASWRGKSKDAFWTDPQLISDFEDIIRYVLTRTNTLTGVRYADDKAILCWETGNEVRGATPQWTKTIAAFIKSIDKNHLVMDGYDAGIRPEILDARDVDIVTTHHYPSSGNALSLGDQIRADAKLVAGRKAYIIGEFGFVKTDEMRDAMRAIMDSQDSGGLLWSLRFRNRNGGFYWHSEPDGADLFKAFHWPPSPIGDPYDETGLMNSVRADAYAIRGLAVPEIPIPAAPVLLPIADAGAISWQGSVGSTSYQVERAAGSDGPWQVISSNVDEAFTQYCPQFADEQVSAGSWFYRIRAKNASGTSEASNIVGPVNVTTATLVDTMADFSRTQSHSEGWKLVDHDCRVTKEYVHRASGIAGETMIYQLATPIEGFRVFSFFPSHPSTIKFSISKDGIHFQDIATQAENEFHGTGDYGYWLPVLYHAENVSAGTFLRIELTGETQIGRIEISHLAPTP